MKFNSKFFSVFVFYLLAAGFIWEGCQNQSPSAAPLAAPPVDQYSILALTAADLGMPVAQSMVNTHLYVEAGKETAITSFTALAKASVYAMGAVTVMSGPLPFQLSPVFPDPGEAGQHNYICNTYNCSVWPGGYNTAIISTGLTDGSNDQYGVSVTGFINDPENPAYPPGAGNPDPVVFEFFPYFSSGGFNPGTGTVNGTYDLTPFQGIQFYVNIATIDDAVDRQFQVMTAQAEPGNQTPVGTCATPDRPDLTHCYDNFEYDFTNTPRNEWVLIQKYWGDLKQYGFGSPQTPPTLSGANLQQCEGFLWIETNAGTQGPITINFSLAGMKFF
jgi:hypothetical protein